ncbi:DsbA family protein [Roseisalinus antarcticus]|uniref:Disulfide bond formation protein D n=1 Tax=Roseisalinus antarcticus TaxID=254357 RepID=A0A1Y5SKJ2_9RHOB|nr:DsbA family protein [Roseisalinus antarcticus]SLN42565.1 Disulfide bond formation protein D precursor [Roseisalinus antarcticus]
MTKILSILALAVAFVAGGTWFLANRGNTTDMPVGAALAQTEDAADLDTSSIVEMSIGAEDAPVTVIEYASFTCPHCRNFHETVYPEFKANYIDTGEVRMIYREVYFDLPGLWASMIARCGGEERFFSTASMIYERQAEWVQGDGNAIADNLRRLALSTGLTSDEVDACFSDATKAQTLIAWFEENREADNVTSTPTFIIDGEKFEGNWVSGLLPAIDAAIGE